MRNTICAEGPNVFLDGSRIASAGSEYVPVSLVVLFRLHIMSTADVLVVC